jgi:catechol 2,3-dioxygenase-like lactoylglutathione lyase family enzyme
MIKVTDLAYVRLRAPDLDRMETFLTDFGLARAARTPTALYMRGTDAQHHLHITELGDPGFVGVGLHAASAADLDTIARAAGLGFIPVQHEHYDFVVPKARAQRPGVRTFRAWLDDPATRERLARLGMKV